MGFTAVSVVINTMGRLEPLKQCISGLRFQEGIVFDLVVVVGPHSEDALHYLASEVKDATIVECPLANLGVSRNLGWRHAAGELVAFIDDDAVPLPGWLLHLVEGFRSPKVGVTGGFVRDNTGAKFQWQYLTIDSLCNPVEYTSVQYNNIETTTKQQDPTYPRFSYPAGTNIMIRRTALQDANGFDEVYAYAADDADLCFRLHERNWSIVHVPSAQVLHHYAPSHQRTRNNIPKTLTDTVRSFVYFKIKHGRKHYSTDVVLDNIHNYIASMVQWIKNMQNNDKISEEDSIRLCEEVYQGEREGMRSSLALGPPDFITANLAIPVLQKRTFKTHAHQSKMRICLVARELPPLPAGGIGIWTWALAKELAAMGHEVHVIAEAQNHATMEFVDGCWVHRSITAIAGLRNVPNLLDFPDNIRENAWRVYDTVAQLEAERPFDMVSAPLWEAQGIALLRGRKRPTAVSLHTPMRTVIRTSTTWHPDNDWIKSYGNALMAAECELLLQSPVIIGNSLAIIDEIENEYKLTIPRDRLFIVPHGVDDIDGWKHDIQHPMRKLLFVGRFEGRKGIDILLSALPSLMTRYTDLTVELIGDNSITDENRQSQWANFKKAHSFAPWLSRIKASGIVDAGHLLEAYRNCDIFVAPSRFESFGLIYIEAMRFCKPVVALNIGAAREIIEHNIDGLLVNGESPEDLGDAITRLMDNPELRNAIGRRARQKYEQKYTSSQMGHEMIEVFSQYKIANK
jgi:glycosyltransferase involved in cell wall biosynthesis/GT2 family glycosyltransferase